MNKRGRPPGAKTWHKTRGTLIASEFHQCARLFGLPITDAADDVAEFFCVQRESVLRSFYRHKERIASDFEEDAYTQLCLLMSAHIDDIFDAIQGKMVEAMRDVNDSSLIKAAMSAEFLQDT